MTNRILLFGASGMVGKELVKKLTCTSSQLLLPTHTQLDLLKQNEVEKYFENNPVDSIVLCAAESGNINKMAEKSFQILQNNLLIAQNTICCAHKYNIQKLIFISSSCIYPENEERIKTEADILSGPFPSAQEGYGMSKIVGNMLCESYCRQYGREYISLNPVGVFGDPETLIKENPQVLPSLILKISEAKQKKQSEVVLWGTGRPVREFIHVSDVADAIVHLLQQDRLDQYSYNIGNGNPVTINELAKIVAEELEYRGKIIFDSSKADGAMYKAVNSDKLKSTGWSPRYNLREGIKQFIHACRSTN